MFSVFHCWTSPTVVYLTISFNTVKLKFCFNGLFHYHFTFPSLGGDYIWMFPFNSSFPFKLFNVSVPTFPVTSLLTCAAGKDQDKTQGRRSRAPSLAETEEALAQAVWCWAGIATWVWLMYLTYLWTAMSWVCQWFPNSVSSLFQWQQLFPASRRCSRIVPLVSTSEKTQVWLSDRPLPLRPDHSPHRKHS